MTTPAIELKGVSKVLGDEVKHTVIHDMNLRIERGDFVALTGTSGSGKSTLLYLLGALDLPTTGTVHVMDANVAEISDNARSDLRGRSLGFVFQFHFLLGELSASENVALPMLRAGVARGEAMRIARETLTMLDVGELVDRRPSRMSGGQQQRVAIARAVAHGPAILLADEPTGSLDSENSARVMALLEGLNRDQQLTIILVTHDEEIAARAHRHVILRDGRVVSDTRSEAIR